LLARRVSECVPRRPEAKDPGHVDDRPFKGVPHAACRRLPLHSLGLDLRLVRLIAYAWWSRIGRRLMLPLTIELSRSTGPATSNEPTRSNRCLNMTSISTRARWA